MVITRALRARRFARIGRGRGRGRGIFGGMVVRVESESIHPSPLPWKAPLRIARALVKFLFQVEELMSFLDPQNKLPTASTVSLPKSARSITPLSLGSRNPKLRRVTSCSLLTAIY